MKNNYQLFIKEIVAGVVLTFLVSALLNPFGWLMPSPTVMMLNWALVAVFAIFVGLVWKEQARDERELVNRTMADRAAFLAGLGVLVVGIIVQGLEHRIDQWLVAALAVMIFAKIVTSVYNNFNH